jgi:hypothetical protein
VDNADGLDAMKNRDFLFLQETELLSIQSVVRRYTDTAAPALVMYIIGTIGLNLTRKKTPWSECASELYRPSDRRLSVK